MASLEREALLWGSAAPSDESSIARPATPSLPSTSSELADVCRYRTSRYSDDECSRYFDCPSHIVDRAASDDGDDDREEDPGETSRGIDGAAAVTSGHSLAVVPPLDDHDPSDGTLGQIHGQGRRGMGSRISPGRIIENESGRSAQQLDPAGSIAGSSAENPIDSTEDTPPTRWTSGTPDGGSAPTRPLRSPHDDQVQPAQIAGPAGHSSPRQASADTPANSRGLPLTRPGFVQTQVPLAVSVFPDASGSQQQSGQSDFTLPRWQSDAEVMYCPICRTQFSIFVRKHHCR